MNFWTASVKVGVMVLIAIVFLTILLTNAENWPWATAGDETDVSVSFCQWALCRSRCLPIWGPQLAK